MMGFGLYSISPFHDATNFELLLLGFYLIMLGASSLRDGFFLKKGEAILKLKRRMRMTLPIIHDSLEFPSVPYDDGMKGYLTQSGRRKTKCNLERKK